MKALALLILALALAGCQTTAPPPPQVSIAGPTFPASRFRCGQRPLPPNPKTAGDHGGSQAAHYENRLGTWGQHCSNQLQAVGAALEAAGQVAK